ncbi:MAG: hypothetical protein HY744_28045 [Deltaproteobacteria bacterium]|nr:hypothetical protein [Deltaproteobacteria bacterium]
MRGLGLVWLLVTAVLAAASCGEAFTTSPASSSAGGAGAAGAAGAGGEGTSAGGAGGGLVGPDGGGGDDGPPECGVVEQACCSCTASSCSAKHEKCFSTPACVEMLACTTACGDNDLCVVGCFLEHGSGGVEMGVYSDCAAQQCAAVCPFAEPLNDCQRCTLPACEPEVEACWQSQDCWALIDCALDCQQGDSTCYQQCNQQHPEGQVLFAKVLQCQKASCSALCG